MHNRLATGAIKVADLVEASIAGTEARESKLKAWACFDVGYARHPARVLDALRKVRPTIGPLRNRPVALDRTHRDYEVITPRDDVAGTAELARALVFGAARCSKRSLCAAGREPQGRPCQSAGTKRTRDIFSAGDTHNAANRACLLHGGLISEETRVS